MTNSQKSNHPPPPGARSGLTRKYNPITKPVLFRRRHRVEIIKRWLASANFDKQKYQPEAIPGDGVGADINLYTNTGC